MPASLEGPLVVARSSRALFDFEEENRGFEDREDSAYMLFQPRNPSAVANGARHPWSLDAG
jgi:hypothetical protein